MTARPDTTGISHLTAPHHARGAPRTFYPLLMIAGVQISGSAMGLNFYVFPRVEETLSRHRRRLQRRVAYQGFALVLAKLRSREVQN